MTDLSSRFEFEAQIGKGGWAQVWKARDLTLRRNVAIKLFEPGGSAISSAVAHAQALARVNHPNVVSVYEVGTCTHPETHEIYNAIVMELLSGCTLLSLCDKGLTSEDANNYSRGLLSGLLALHEAGVVHTDLHGENVMVHHGTAKLLDVLYRGTLALQPKTRRQQLLKQDLKQAISEIANLLIHSDRAAAASEFRHLAGDAEGAAQLQGALEAVISSATGSAIQTSSGAKNKSRPKINLSSWHSDCLTRFQEALSGASEDVATLYKTGYWSVAYSLASDRIAPSDLLDKMRSANGWTGWRPWWVPTRQGWEPYSKGGKIECWIKHFPDAQDGWRRTPSSPW